MRRENHTSRVLHPMSEDNFLKGILHIRWALSDRNKRRQTLSKYLSYWGLTMKNISVLFQGILQGARDVKGCPELQKR